MSSDNLKAASQHCFIWECIELDGSQVPDTIDGSDNIEVVKAMQNVRQGMNQQKS